MDMLSSQAETAKGMQGVMNKLIELAAQHSEDNERRQGVWGSSEGPLLTTVNTMNETRGVMKKYTAMLQARIRAILIAKELSCARIPFSCLKIASSQPAFQPNLFTKMWPPQGANQDRNVSPLFRKLQRCSAYSVCSIA